MKTVSCVVLIMLFALFSCNSGVKTNGQKATFGIYEIVNSGEIPQPVMDTLKSRGIIMENARQPMMGYVKTSDSSFQLNLTGQNFKLFRTINPVDKENQYDAIVTVGLSPALNNSDIKNVWASGNRVEIDFNYNGAKKWADFTEKNTGKWVAFVINGRIYSTPLVLNEIREGKALITGFKDAESAKNIAESLDASIQN